MRRFCASSAAASCDACGSPIPCRRKCSILSRTVVSTDRTCTYGTPASAVGAQLASASITTLRTCEVTAASRVSTLTSTMMVSGTCEVNTSVTSRVNSCAASASSSGGRRNGWSAGTMCTPTSRASRRGSPSRRVCTCTTYWHALAAPIRAPALGDSRSAAACCLMPATSCASCIACGERSAHLRMLACVLRGGRTTYRCAKSRGYTDANVWHASLA